jgi:hypothetical protein
MVPLFSGKVVTTGAPAMVLAGVDTSKK